MSIPLQEWNKDSKSVTKMTTLTDRLTVQSLGYVGNRGFSLLSRILSSRQGARGGFSLLQHSCFTCCLCMSSIQYVHCPWY